MDGSTRFKAIAIAGLLVLFTFLTAANFVPKEERVNSELWPDDGLRLGLDLRGGLHWVLGVELDEAMTRELEFVRKSIEERLEKDGIALESSLVENGELELVLAQEADRSKVIGEADDTTVLEQSDESGLALRFRLTEDWETDVRDRTMSQVLEVMRRRIDDPQTGVPDSVITRQGKDRVLIQIPGEQIDRDRLYDLVITTGFLEFKIVEDSDNTEEALRARYPDGLGADRVIVNEVDPESGSPVAAYLVPKLANITGDYLEDARLQFDQQQRPIVEFRFSPAGGEIFGDLTESNLRRPLAIILDNQVYSAPTIQGRISTRGQITGNYTSQEAADLAVILRAGSLSVPVVIEEERTVGPGLGHDSITSGARACAIGLTIVLVFAVAYYRLSGTYACIALLSNLVLLVGLMSLWGATLTLPGIAGLVLTVGMAVDANVIIFERIREELRSGRAVRAAISTGFNKATWTVLDANITTLFTSVILFEFGTGPIKGFAVTLSIGIVTSVFAALVITRLLFQIYPGNRHVSSLSI